MSAEKPAKPSNMKDSASSAPSVVVDKPQSLDTMLTSDRVVVLGRSTCPFCTEVDGALTDRLPAGGRSHVYYRLDELANGKDLHAQLKVKTGQTSVPYVFVNGNLVGGCTDVFAGGYDGSLSGVLGPLPETMAAADKDAPSKQPGALFLFPNTVDARVVRTTGATVSFAALIIAILGVFEETHDAAKWMAVGLLVDFVLRFFAGANGSVLGAVAAMLVGVGERLLGTKPRFRGGVPKQFAQFIGVMFSGLAAIFLLIDKGTWSKWVAFFFLAGLSGAAAMEGFLNFCLGCVFFGYGVKFGIFPTSVYALYVNELADTHFTWHDWNKKRSNFGHPEPLTKQQPNRSVGSKVDLQFKVKTDDMRRQEFGAVRYFHVGYWAFPLSLTALAFLFYLNTALPSRYMPKAVWQTLAIIAVLVWAAFLFLQVARMVKFPRKVYKEWTCPIRSNAFVFPTMCMLIFVIFAVDPDGADSRTLGKVLLWAAAPLQLLICVRILSQWMYYLRNEDHVSVLWLAVPLCNVFAATAYVSVYPSASVPNTYSAAQLWMGFAVLLFAALYPTSLHRAIMGHNQVMEDRATHWLLAAAPAALAIGWQVLYGADLTVPFVVLYFGALALTACFLYGIYPMRFHCRGRFHMGLWAVAFTLSALALCATLFDNRVFTDASNVIRLSLIAAACVANWICLMHFIRDVFTFKVFTADKMAAPLLFFRLSHEAARGIMGKMRAAMDEVNIQKRESVGGLLRLWDDYEFFTRVHMLHEDNVIFYKADEWMPHHSDPFAEEHELDKKHMVALNVLFAAVRSAHEASQGGIPSEPLLTALSALRPKLTEALDFFDRHLTHEEDRLSPVLRKNLNIPRMRSTIQEIWAVTDSVDWFRFLPLVVNSIRRHPERIMFVRMLLWAMPERASQIGTILALGMDTIMWQRLSEEVPDINPRGMPGWHRF